MRKKPPNPQGNPNIAQYARNGKAGAPEGNTNGFVHGLTLIKQKRHRHGLPRGKDKRFKLELFNSLIEDAGGLKNVTAAKRLQAEIIATDATFLGQMDRAIQRVLRLVPKYKENAVAGTHGKTFLFAGFDEIWAYKDWDILEALQLDPSRPDAMMWITSYATVFHRPGIPLFDLLATAKKGTDPRMFFSWYAADYVTDPAFENLSPEGKANPSASNWDDAGYLIQQQSRLPSHKYRRLHLNLPGSPEGSAYSAEKIMDSVERGVSVRPPVSGRTYFAFVDMSGGSIDDATLGISHRSPDGSFVLDRIVDQGQRPPFDPRKAVKRFAAVLEEYKVKAITGDRYAGETFRQDFRDKNISYRVSELTKSEIYEEIEPLLNGGRIVLLDHPNLE